MTFINGCPCHSRYGTLKNHHCSMAMSIICSPSPAGNGDVSIWVKNSQIGRKTPNKQTNELCVPYQSILFLSKMLHNMNHMSSRANIQHFLSLSDRKALASYMSPCAFGIGWHNAPRLSRQLGANILSCQLEAIWHTGLCWFAGKLCQLDSY